MEDLNRRALVQWVVNTVGRALTVALLIPLALGVLAAASDDPSWLFLSFAGPLVGAYMLWTASAPFPEYDGDYETEDAQ